MYNNCILVHEKSTIQHKQIGHHRDIIAYIIYTIVVIQSIIKINTPTYSYMTQIVKICLVQNVHILKYVTKNTIKYSKVCEEQQHMYILSMIARSSVRDTHLKIFHTLLYNYKN